MAKRATPELKAAIRRYNKDGWSYYALARIVPYTKEAIAKWCDNGLRARQKKNDETWRANHREYHRQATAKWTAENAEYVKAARKERYYREFTENPNMNKEYHLKYREKRNAASAAYRKANKEKMRQLDHDWVRNNPDKNAAKTAKIRAGNACPPWITEEQKQEMLNFYTEAHLRSIETGEKYDVDHVHPLKSRKVDACGLHVPWNLQVLLAEDNRKKSDSYET
jgi:hypothetical protein